MHRSGSEPAAPEPTPRQGSIVERLSRYGMQVMPAASPRRSRLQRQQEVTDGSAPDRESVPPVLRRKYLKELLLSRASSSAAGSSGLLQSLSPDQEDSDWALYPMEHAWMLRAVEGNYETILDFISEDPQLLTRRDFISGYSVLHWLAKGGRDEVLLKLLRFAERAGFAVNVNLRGSGGLTPLHVASMQGQFAVIKLLVGAFGANVDAMDYNGKRPWQYLREDAPVEMKELLGTWDEEHSCGCAQNFNKNVNNNCAGSASEAACDEADGQEPEEMSYFDRAKRGSWRFESLRKLKSSFSFVRSKT
ncbi:ankyrin repeat domain-containing protein SOWAHD-like isoform X1 [Poeciliopsis prolifica]|uniref:ankyrin repeat domain-containing protein SOWAHD-like isoform X1 n=1 Tax=Poeciliopsis prolifica TaxID=188132 RepID=UPI0024133DE9|nr:ankyrin repeat domain-containing protein SOWAHD-like isoform X1 [Poeciliopsis prolifica]XP_054886356.1 ankyrin repeat domain-containing protein SOWAHD-like isoform X1 [Poeciliopsis prolifica]